MEWIEILLSGSSEKAIIDHCDSWIVKYKWRYYRGYAVRTGYVGLVAGKKKHTTLRMGREILAARSNQRVIHMDKNGLNCRRSNLVLGSQKNVNEYRLKSIKVNTKYKGVRKGYKGKFVAEIKNNYKSEHLGTFDTEAEAIVAYNKRAVELFGAFAITNPPKQA